jgi:hypothetical protein
VKVEGRKSNRVVIFPYMVPVGGKEGCAIEGCRGEAAWWIEELTLAICDSCLLSLLRVLAHEQRIYAALDRWW